MTEEASGRLFIFEMTGSDRSPVPSGCDGHETVGPERNYFSLKLNEKRDHRD